MKTHQRPSAKPTTAKEVPPLDDLFAILDAAAAKLPKKPKKKNTARELNALARKLEKERLAEEWKTAPDRAVARKKTGYVTWVPVARRHILRSELCECCGTQTLRYEGTFFVHQCGTAHAEWLHHEGMMLPLDGEPLPVETQVLSDEPRRIPICGECHGSPEIEALIRQAQYQMELPV